MAAEEIKVEARLNAIEIVMGVVLARVLNAAPDPHLRIGDMKTFATSHFATRTDPSRSPADSMLFVQEMQDCTDRILGYAEANLR